MNARHLRCALILALFPFAVAIAGEWSIPINATNRRSWSEIRLTPIGRFGLRRRARPGVPAHLHTGMDIRRPSRNYVDEPVYPAMRGIVISVREDGPFAQVIIEHLLPDSSAVWTVYEHLSGICAAAGDTVAPGSPIGRFMTRAELDRYGWQFDHLHFEVLRMRPHAMSPSQRLPMRLFRTYALECRDPAMLSRRCFDPQTFLEEQWQRNQ